MVFFLWLLERKKAGAEIPGVEEPERWQQRWRRLGYVLGPNPVPMAVSLRCPCGWGGSLGSPPPRVTHHEPLTTAAEISAAAEVVVSSESSSAPAAEIPGAAAT